MPRYHVQISARILSWPKVCACCGNEATTKRRTSASKSTGKRVVTTTTCWWEIPYCSHCIEHIEQEKRAIRTLLAGAAVAAIVVLLIGDFFNSLFTGLVGGILPMAAFVKVSQDMKQGASDLRRPECPCVGPAVEYQGWYGTSHDFVFSNRHYLELFLESNRQKTRSDISEVS
jgi:hypothetical protein